MILFPRAQRGCPTISPTLRELLFPVPKLAFRYHKLPLLNGLRLFTRTMHSLHTRRVRIGDYLDIIYKAFMIVVYLRAQNSLLTNSRDI